MGVFFEYSLNFLKFSTGSQLSITLISKRVLGKSFSSEKEKLQKVKLNLLLLLILFSFCIPFVREFF